MDTSACLLLLNFAVSKYYTMDLKNSTVLITGGTSGIGLELVNQLTDQGANIIITGRNSDALQETKKQFKNIHIFKSDVSNSEDIRHLMKPLPASFRN